MIDNSASGYAYNRLTNLDGIEDRIIWYLLYYENKTKEEKEIVTKIRRILLYNNFQALLTLEEGGYPDPDSRENINVTDKTADDYYCGLALVPQNQGLKPYPGTNVEVITSQQTTSNFIWVKADDAISNLIFNDDDVDFESSKRVFRSPRLDAAFTAECSLLKIYVDSITPVNHLNAVVNVGIDIITHSQIINLKVSDRDKNYFIQEGTSKTGDKYIIPVHTKSRVTVLTQAIIALLNGAQVQGVGTMVFSRDMSIYNRAQYGIWNNRDFEGMKLVMGVSMSGVS